MSLRIGKVPYKFQYIGDNVELELFVDILGTRIIGAFLLWVLCNATLIYHC